MSDPTGVPGFHGSETPTPQNHSHRAPRRRRSAPAALVLVVLLVVLGGIVYAGGSWLKDRLAGDPDYPGPGTGRVSFTIAKDESIREMGNALKKLDVVKSSDAFVSAASHNADATGIQPGSYLLKRQMKASDVVAVLVDPANLDQSVVTIPEGTRTATVIELVAAHSKITRAALKQALAKPGKLGLPAYAHGDPEGYLFPATYTISPKETATQLLTQMIAKFKQEAASIDLVGASKAVNLDPEQTVIVASILEYEASRSADYPKVARAIYNRLRIGMPLQSDATVSYANNLTGQVWTTAAERAVQSAYNTYTHQGLPPGAIGNPGIETIKAALHPAKGPWLYWVVVNLATGKTVFSTTYAQHQAATEQLRQYCKTSDAC
ncbi:endolytic transglycosylase MltG [Nocardioides ultimimeridianus]